MLADEAESGALGEVAFQQRAGVHIPKRACLRRQVDSRIRSAVSVFRQEHRGNHQIGHSGRQQPRFEPGRSLRIWPTFGLDLTDNSPRANHAFRAGQNFLRVDPFFRVAFEPWHLAIFIFSEPFLKLFGAGGRGGGGETAIVKAQLQRPLADGFLSSRTRVAQAELMDDLLRDFARRSASRCSSAHRPACKTARARRAARGFSPADLDRAAAGDGDWCRTRSQIFSGEDQRQTTSACALRLARFFGFTGSPPPVEMTVFFGGKFPPRLLSPSPEKRSRRRFAKISAIVLPVRGLDHLIRVEKFEAQLVGDEPAHGGLARAHETDERDVDDMAALCIERSFKFQLSCFKGKSSSSSCSSS